MIRMADSLSGRVSVSAPCRHILSFNRGEPFREPPATCCDAVALFWKTLALSPPPILQPLYNPFKFKVGLTNGRPVSPPVTTYSGRDVVTIPPRHSRPRPPNP